MIAFKIRSFILTSDNLLQNIPKKDYYYRDEFKKEAILLLKNVYNANETNNKEDKKKYLFLIKTNISIIDFLLEIFLDHKYISDKEAKKSVYKLSEIMKMTKAWLKEEGIDGTSKYFEIEKDL